jgi:hypothetical protein
MLLQDVAARQLQQQQQQQQQQEGAPGEGQGQAAQGQAAQAAPPLDAQTLVPAGPVATRRARVRLERCTTRGLEDFFLHVYNK